MKPYYEDGLVTLYHGDADGTPSTERTAIQVVHARGVHVQRERKVVLSS